jgi:predicted RNA binding protein YcfA (HicA-like mRNA interferase family)
MSRRLPTLKPRQVIRARERAGFVFDRASGGHRDPTGPAGLRPRPPGDLKRPVVRSILRQADLAVDTFLDLL